MEVLLSITIAMIPISFVIGEFIGIKETFNMLEKEGKIITKDDLKKPIN